MPIRKLIPGAHAPFLTAEGIMYHDLDAVTPCQLACAHRFSRTVQLENEAYISQHPELPALLELFLSAQIKKKMMHINVFKAAGEFFLDEELDSAVRNRLGVGPNDPYTKQTKNVYKVDDEHQLILDLKALKERCQPSPPWSLTPSPPPTIITESSSFLSLWSSDTTLPTPEPTPVVTPTISQYFMGIISITVDKAIYTRYDEQAVLYDVSYMEVSKAVEAAMEIPVECIKEDIHKMYEEALNLFEGIITERERIVDEIKWEKRMRKKMKRTLRRQNNFKGYETPPESSISSHESYRHAPPRPCSCHPQYHYNRIPKDRFGIYLPRQEKFEPANTTLTPILSVVESVVEEEGEDDADYDTKSAKSGVSGKSGVSKSSRTSKGATVKFN